MTRSRRMTEYHSEEKIMSTMFEQLQQIKQQMTTSKTEKNTRTTSAHKVQGDRRKSDGNVTPWLRAQQAKKADMSRQRKAVPVTTKPVQDKKSDNPQQPEKTNKNRQRKKNRKKLLKLVSFWPDAFDLDKPRPLAMGIDAAIKADMDARDIGCKGLILFTLGRYATHRKYLEALVVGGPRYDLNGNPCGEVTPEEQKQAAGRLEAMNAFMLAVVHSGDAEA